MRTIGCCGAGDDFAPSMYVCVCTSSSCRVSENEHCWLNAPHPRAHTHIHKRRVVWPESFPQCGKDFAGMFARHQTSEGLQESMSDQFGTRTGLGVGMCVCVCESLCVWPKSMTF